MERVYKSSAEARARTKAWTAKNKDKKKETDRAYREKNLLSLREKARIRSAKNRNENPEGIRANQKRYADKNKKKASKYNAERYAKNREAILARNKTWQKANRDKVRATVRKWRTANPEVNKRQALAERLRTYNLAESQINRMEDSQGYRCAICCTVMEDANGKAKSLHIDHCHRTKVVRGMLCRCCNLGLGMFKDSLGLLRNAQQYLLDH